MLVEGSKFSFLSQINWPALVSSFPHLKQWFVKREPLPVFYISPALLMSTRKYYDLLEVSPNASEADLKKAYRKKFSVLQLFFLIVSLIVLQSS
jgi:hypothetical protein